MATQVNAQHHIKVWHDDFWKLNVANFSLALAIYMLIPVLPSWLANYVELSAPQVAIAMSVHGVGIYLLGVFCSYLIQRYRRNKVCIFSMLLVCVSILGLAYLSENMVEHNLLQYAFPIITLLRFLQGTFFGLAYMVLNSTLIVDCCETTQRTLANVVSAWSYRLAVVAGPLLGIILEQESGFLNTIYVSAFFCLISVGILSSVSFPFKAPDDTMHVFSSDRFFRFSGMSLVASSFLIAGPLGILLVSLSDNDAYVCLFVGVLVSLAIQKLIYKARCRKRVAVCGYVLLFLSYAGICCMKQQHVLGLVSITAFGFAISMVLTNLHIRFIETADHCQRGTSQSTFILSFESGISLGIFLALLPTVAVQFHLLGVSIGMLLVSFVSFAFAIRK